MPTTTNRAYRYPQSTDAPNVPLDLQHLAEDVDTDAEAIDVRVLALEADSGWVAVTMATGWTTNSALYVRKVGNRVSFKGHVANNASSIVPTGDNSTVCTLDAAYRPGAAYRGPIGGWVSGGAAPEYRAQAVSIATSGVMDVHANGNQTRVFLDGVSYLTD